MEKETVIGYMKDQPRALRETIKNKHVFVEPFLEVFKKYPIKKILFFGSGTSYNASVIAAYYFKQICDIDATAHYPTVFKNYDKPDWTGKLEKNEILFVGISQSGTSISTIEVMKKAKKDGYHTLVLTEALTSEITKHVNTVIHLLCGKEITPPETRGYTVTMMTIYLWAVELANLLNKLTQPEYEKYIFEAKTLTEEFEKVVSESENWYERNKCTIINSDRIFVLGYGVDYGSALEGQLKIGEMLRLPTLSYEIEEYSHGPTMAISPRQTIFMIGSDDVEWNRMLKFREVFKKYSDRVHLVTCVDTATDERDIVFTTKVNKYLAPIAYTVPFQFVAAKGALDIGIDTNENPFEDELAHLPNEN